MPKEIDFYSGRGKYSVFSNFHRSPFILDGERWPTVEHYFQAQKTLDITERIEIRLAPTPLDAKIMGRNCTLRPDWEDIKDDVMYKALVAKFEQSEMCRKILLESGDAIIHEDSPYDKYWGKKGQDMLGKLLMKVRDYLRTNKEEQ
jgi:ribA/ribD-fused uncharacterized protein